MRFRDVWSRLQRDAPKSLVIKFKGVSGLLNLPLDNAREHDNRFDAYHFGWNDILDVTSVRFKTLENKADYRYWHR